MIGVVLGMIFPVVFNGLFFYLKGVHNSIVAWVAFAMINCSYVTMLAMIKNRKRGEAGLLHWSKSAIAVTHFLAQFIAGMAFILWASAPVKAAVVTHVILWGAFLACTLTNRGISSATIATSSIKKGEILRIKSLAYDVRELICLAKDKKLQKTTEKLYDAIVSSQAQSCTAAIPIEKELRESISELSDHIRSGNEDGAQRIVNKALVLLGERESSIQKSRM